MDQSSKVPSSQQTSDVARLRRRTPWVWLGFFVLAVGAFCWAGSCVALRKKQHDKEQTILRHLSRFRPRASYDADFAGSVIYLSFPESASFTPEERIADEHLAVLKGFPNLLGLDLTDTSITDAGLATVASIPHLETLTLTCTELTDRGVAHLEALSHLARLELWGTHVTDDGLRHLQGLRRLRVLGLGRTRVTDRGLRYLSGLANLEKLDLTETDVTLAAIADLQKALPKTLIVH